MPENDTFFNVRFPDGHSEQWKQADYDQYKDDLFKEFKDAEVTRLSTYMPDKDTDALASDQFHIAFSDGHSEVWGRKDFDTFKGDLMKEDPAAKIFKASDMSQQYWGPKAQEAESNFQEFKGLNQDFIKQYEQSKNLADSLETEGVSKSEYHDFVNSNREKYDNLVKQGEELKRQYYTNPLVVKAFRDAADTAVGRRDEYRAKADSASSGDERRDWKRAAKLQDDIRKLYEAPAKYSDDLDSENGFIDYLKDYTSGAVDTFSNKDFYTLGLSKIARNFDLRGIAEKIQGIATVNGEVTPEDIDKVITPSEKAELQSFYELATAQQQRADNISSAYNAGGTFAESIKFMAEFLASQGLANVAGKALSGSSNALASWLGRQLMSERALAKAIGEGVTTASKGAKAALFAEEFLTRPITQGLFHTATQLSSLEAIADGLLDTDSNGKLVSVGQAVSKSLLDQLVENTSESLGEAVEKTLALPFKGLGWAGEHTIGKTQFGRWARWLYNSAPTQLLKEAGFNGMLGEIGEEWVGNAARVGLGLMSKDEFKDFASWEQQLEMAASFAPLSLFGLGSSTAAAIRKSKNYENLSGQVRGILEKQGRSEDEIEDLFNTRFDTAEDVGKKLAPYLREVSAKAQEEGATKENKEDYKTVLEFARELGIQTVMEEVQKLENADKRQSVRENIESVTGRFWQDTAGDENTPPTQSVRVVKDEEGNLFYVTEVGEDGLLTGVSPDGQKKFLEESKLTQDDTIPMEDFLQEQVDALELDEEAQRMEEERLQQINDVRQRVAANPVIPIGTPEAPINATVIAADNAGVQIAWEEDGQQKTDTMSWGQVAASLGTPIEVKSDAELEEEAAEEIDKARERVETYKGITPGSEMVVMFPTGEGEEMEAVPYKFDKAVLEDGQVLFYGQDEEGKTVIFPESMIGNLEDLVASSVGEEATTPFASGETVSYKDENGNTIEGIVTSEDAGGGYTSVQLPDGTTANVQTVRLEKAEEREEEKTPAVAKYTDENGRVNQNAFISNEPEEWAKWNDEQNQDNGADSIEAIGAAISELDGTLKEQENTRKKTSNPDERAVIKADIAQLTERRNRLQAILDGYVAKADAAVAAAEAITEPVAEQTPAEVPAPMAEETPAQEVKAEPTQEDAEAARVQTLKDRVRAWVERTGVEADVCESPDQVENKKAAKAIAEGQPVAGWFEPNTGKVVIYLPNILDEAEIDRTYMHEVISHKGLRDLLGNEGWNTLMDSVWNNLMTEKDRADYLKYNSHLKGTEEFLRRAAADEYVAHLAENVNTENMSAWQKFAEMVKEILLKLGMDVKLTTEDLSNLLQASLANYERMQAEKRAAELAVNEEATAFVKEGDKLTSYIDAPTGQKSPSAPDETMFSLRREEDSKDDEGKTVPGLRTLADGFLAKLADKPLTPEELAIGSDAIGEMVNYMMPYLDMVKDGKRYLPEEIFGKGWSTIFKNGSYGRTMENTLICMRTLAYNDFVNAVQEKVGRPLTPTESFLASQMLYDIATDPQCLYCYVALDRKAYNGFLKTYIEQRDAVLDKYKTDDSIDKTYRLPAQEKSRKNRKALSADNQVNKLYLEYLDGRADTPSMRNRFNGWLDRIAEGSLIGMKDLTSPETRQKVAGKGASYAAQIDDAEKYAQSASWAKKQEEYRAYNGELLSMPQKVVNLLNSEYGLRFYSFSEYSPAFIVENMQMVRDAALRGLVGLAYTKEIDFAKIFAPTGININISCYGREAEDGTVVMDTKQGADWGEAQALRERYGNVGCVFVATNDRMVEWAIHQPWVDVVIPFHIVRTGEDIAKFYDWTNYTAMEADKDVKGRSRDIMPTEHMNDKDTFLQLCEERGLKPRFADLVLPSTGRSVTEDPDYMKLVNETRRSVNETVPIKPIFDTQEAKRSFDEFVDKGGYYAGWFTEEGAFERGVEQVAADVEAGKTAKDVDYGRQDIKASAEKLAAMAGKKKRPRSHQGTPRRIGGDKITKAQQNVLNYLETGEFKSEVKGLEGANAAQKRPVSETSEPVVTEGDVMFRLSNNNRATVESWLKKREDINDEQRAEVVDYIDKLDDAKTQLATAKWYANGKIRIPEDMPKVKQAISVAGKAKVDPLQYDSPMALLDAHAEFKPTEERINPDEVSTLHRAAEYPDSGIVVYDVDNTKESRENMRKIINTHFGEDASPWCLLQGDGKGNLTESSAKYWKHYNAYPKQVAFKDGKLLAFSANDSHTRVWWDRQDQSHYGIPITMKVEGDELGRSAVHILNENKELGLAKAELENLERELANKYNCPPYRLKELVNEEDLVRLDDARDKVNMAYRNGGEPGWIVEPGTHLFKGNQQNGVYEEWSADGSQILSHTEYKDGKENGVTEQWYPSGQLWKRAVMKEDLFAGTYEMWYENGQQKMRVEMNERGEKDGEQVGWYKNGNKLQESHYKEGKLIGDQIEYYETGEPKSIIHRDDSGELLGFEDYVSWRAEKGIKAHIGIGRRVTYTPGDSNRRTEEEFRANGKLHKREEYHGSKLDGVVEYYYPDGTIQTRTHYVEGERNGTKEVYHENGKLWLRGDFKDGEVDGLQEQWNKEGDLILREEWKDGEKVRTLPLDEGIEPEGNVMFRKVTDPAKIEEFEKGEKIPVYASKQLIEDPDGDVEYDFGDGRGMVRGFLVAPMSGKINGKWREPERLGELQEAEENPELADKKGQFKLDKGNGKSIPAMYAPYFHLRRSPLNEQFSEAFNRPNLVIVEGEIPASELTSNYTAEKSKKSTGEHDWPSGKVSNELARKGQDTRKVILSRWFKPTGVVPASKVADEIVKRIKAADADVTFNYNVVTPTLRRELAKRGIKFSGWQGNKPDDWKEQVQRMQEENNDIVLFRRSQDLFNESREGGLTRVIGDENATELYHNVYRAIPKEIRERIVNKAGDGFLFSEATRDAIAEAVENGDPTGLAGLASNMLRDYVGPLDERTARYILWRGDRKAEDDDLLDTVKDITMQRRLQVGQFADPVMFRLSDNLEEAENRAESMADDAKATLDEKKEFAKVNDALTTIKAMSLQKEYDRKTVNTITVLAKNVLKDQSIETLNRREIARLLGIITTSIGKAPKTVKKNADALIGLIVDHLLRSEETKLGMLANTKASKTNQTGVETAAKLDPRGQNILKAYKEGLEMDLTNPDDRDDADTLDGRLIELSEKLESENEVERAAAEEEYAGLMLAKEYQEEIKASRNEERRLRREMNDAAEEMKDGKRSRTAYNQLVEENEKAIRENKIERVEAYQELYGKMSQMIAGSIETLREFKEDEKARVEKIHHLANSDMQGRDATVNPQTTWAGRLANSSVVRFFAQPLATFEQILRLFGEKNIAGEGYLFNYFHRNWIKASENAYLGEKEAKDTLDAKVSEVFDEKMRWNDLYTEERRMPKVTVKWWDSGRKEMVEHELTQGQLLYIYMVNKMTDGRMKLRRMGITQETVDAIKKQMDVRFIELADWLQSEFLVNLRDKYDAVHTRLFGAHMAAIEDYFPLKMNKNSLDKAEDIGRPDLDDALPATSTGAIIKRRRNTKDLDLLNADAFSVVIEHVEQMEQWAAFAEYNKDLNTLLSYKRFRNQVKGMTSVYGSGNELLKNFEATCRIVGGTYRPAGNKSGLDRDALSIAKGVTAAKISFRVYTALKQLLSMPAFVADANVKYLGQNIATPWKAWSWAMDNLPLFEKRWKSRQAGDTRLMQNESDWKFFQSQLYDNLSRLGMSPNAFVDAMTVSIGAHSIYQTRYDRYIKDGYTEEEADKKAKEDATTLYNETQQSSESAFVSKVQLDRTVAAAALTVFRNSSMGYQRQLHDAIRNIGKMMKPGYKAASIEFMKKQMEREGLTEEQAQEAAERNFNRETWRSLARIGTFGFLVQFAWNLGPYLAYLLFGGDDDKKEDMLKEAAVHGLVGGSVEGLVGGSLLSEVFNKIAKKESLNNYDPSLLPIVSDVKNTYKKMSYNPVAGWYDLTCLAAQALVGVNPQTLSDAVVAVVDACDGDLETSREAMLLFLRVIQTPQSQLDQLYIDELGLNGEGASSMSMSEMADRYARYKMNKEAGPLVGLHTEESEKKREKTYKKKFKELVKERKESK